MQENLKPALPFPREKLRTVKSMVLWMAVLLVAASAESQDRPSARSSRWLSANHFGSSPFPPPEPRDDRFVVDQGPGLDTGCVYRSSGPLTIEIPVGRYVGPVSSDGTLQNPSDLIARKVVSAEAKLFLPAFDVDFATPSDFNPERDKVTFNGEVLSPQYLNGQNNTWIPNVFRIPIDLVRFPADPGPNGTITPRINTLRIDIDTDNATEVWCTEIDWVSLEIQAVRPVLLAHGILSSGGTWVDRWVAGLDSRKIPNDRLDMGDLDSISANAGKISGRVDAMCRRWGVDKVNIVAHSKGGIDSRHYVEKNDKVEKLVQIGTPNAGSPLADYVQAGLIGFTGLRNAITINNLAGPAGVQLTRPYMAFYNLFHGANPKVRYVALAGDYSGAPLFSLDTVLGTIIPGPDDTIVPVSSVHALSFTSNRFHESRGADPQAKHTEQTKSIDIFNKLITDVQTFGRAGSLTGPTASHTGTWSTSIAQGEVLTSSVPLDGGRPAFITLYHEGGDLNLAVITPGGTRIDRITAPGLSGVGHSAGDLLGGIKMEAVTIEAPVAGMYTVEVTAAVVTNPAGEEPFLVSGWLSESELVLDARLVEAAVSATEDLRIEANLSEDGTGLSGRSLVAEILAPDESVRSVSLLDGGSGNYTATLAAPHRPGLHRLRVVASGASTAGQSFSREIFLLATVAASGSQITGPYADRGVDLNGNSLYDLLEVDVGLEITDPGSYALVGELTDAAGSHSIATTKVTAELVIGSATVTLPFSGEQIFASGVDGPYRLRIVRLAEEVTTGELDTLLLDEEIDVHTTGAYAYRQFEHSDIRLTGGATLRGVDDDADGRFDRLQAILPIDLRLGGTHQWSARLIGPDGAEVAVASNSGTLAAGEGQIVLDFDGCTIGASGAEGELAVEGLLLFGASGALVETGTLVSAPFLNQQFPCAIISPVGIPTLSVAGLVSLISVLCIGGIWLLRRRRHLS